MHWIGIEDEDWERLRIALRENEVSEDSEKVILSDHFFDHFLRNRYKQIQTFTSEPNELYIKVMKRQVEIDREWR